MQRRTLIGLAAAMLAATTLSPAAAHPTWEGLRRMRRPLRPRLRRRVHVRWVQGRALWVVPLGLAAGWELLHEDRLVVVRETRTVVHEGDQREWATVADAAGKTHEVEILREDTPQAADPQRALHARAEE